MDELLFKNCYELKASIDNNPDVIRLKELEEIMNNSDEIMALAYKKDDAARRYSDMLNYFKDDSKEVIEARRTLSLAKEELQSHPIVKEYLEKYSKVKAIYEKINETLFHGLNSNTCEHKK